MPATKNSNKTLVIVRRAPYGDSLARSAIDSVLAAAAFEQPIKLLFVGDGVLQLVPEQAPANLGCRNMAKLLSSLPLYGVEQVYVDAVSAGHYRLELDRAPVAAEILEPAAMTDLLRQHDHLLGF